MGELIAPFTWGAEPVKSATSRSPDTVIVTTIGIGSGIDAVVVDVIHEPVDSVRHRLDGVPREPLRLVEERIGAGPEPLPAVALEEREVAALAREARGDLGAHVTQDLPRHPHVLVDEVEHRLGRLAPIVEADRRDAQPLLEDLGRVAAISARRLAADVQLVADARRPADQLGADVDRLQDVEVGQVRPALERVVQDERVAGPDLPRELRLHGGHRVGHGPEVERQRQPLGDEPALGVAEGARHVHRVLEIVRVGGAHERDGHLVDDRVQRVLDQLERDGIRGHRFEVTMTLPSR